MGRSSTSAPPSISVWWCPVCGVASQVLDRLGHSRYCSGAVLRVRYEPIWGDADLRSAPAKESGVTLAQTHRAIIEAIQQATRAQLLGLGLLADHLVLLMGVDLDEAEDILARLSEQGLVERA